MKNNRGKILSAFLTFLLLSACSSSSTIRYGKQTTEEKETKDPSVRFTSVDDSMVVDLNLDLKDPSQLPENDPDVDVSSLLASNKSDYTFDVPGYDYTTIREKMLMEIIKYLGVPYKYGGTTKNGIDCSAFTQTVYRDVFNIQLQRSARLQYTQGEIIEKGENLKYGDLVFFNTRDRVKPGHVGIYIGDRLFAHASSKKGVTITSIDYDYYTRTYMGARRFETIGMTGKSQ